MFDFTKRLARWKESGKYQKIADAIEALPKNQQTPDLISLLAWSYCRLAEQGQSEYSHFQKALDLLLPLEKQLFGDFDWNYRVGYAYLHLQRESKALPFLQKALELCPESGNAANQITECRNRIACPCHLKPFSARTLEAWNAFTAKETQLRSLLDQGQADSHTQETLLDICGEVLHLAFHDIAFEIGRSHGKYDLILSPEGDRPRLFQIVYFAERAPESVRKYWNIIVGRPRVEGFGLRMYGMDVTAADFQVWTEPHKDATLGLSLYCDKLLELLKDNENDAYRMVYILLDQTLGEIASMQYISSVRLLSAPMEEECFTLETLSQYIEKALRPQNRTQQDDANAVCEKYVGYQSTPAQGDNWPLRGDVYVGMTCCIDLLHTYFDGADGYMDMFHQDGAVPGFLYWPLAGIEKDAILSLREWVEAEILKKAGPDAVTFTGGATGKCYGYLDFIAWDLSAVLDAAAEVLRDAPVLPEASFHVLRLDAPSLRLKSGN